MLAAVEDTNFKLVPAGPLARLVRSRRLFCKPRRPSPCRHRGQSRPRPCCSCRGSSRARGVALSQGRPAGPRRSPTGATPKGRIRRSGVTRRSRLRSEIMWDARLDTLPSINRRHPRFPLSSYRFPASQELVVRQNVRHLCVCRNLCGKLHDGAGSDRARLLISRPRRSFVRWRLIWRTRLCDVRASIATTTTDRRLTTADRFDVEFRRAFQWPRSNSSASSQHRSPRVVLACLGRLRVLFNRLITHNDAPPRAFFTIGTGLAFRAREADTKFVEAPLEMQIVALMPAERMQIDQ